MVQGKTKPIVEYHSKINKSISLRSMASSSLVKTIRESRRRNPD